MIDGRGYMGCHGGPSLRGYNQGGSILQIDIENTNALTRIGMNNASRGIELGNEFVIKDDRLGGGGVNIVSLQSSKQSNIYSIDRWDTFYRYR